MINEPPKETIYYKAEIALPKNKQLSFSNCFSQLSLGQVMNNQAQNKEFYRK